MSGIETESAGGLYETLSALEQEVLRLREEAAGVRAGQHDLEAEREAHADAERRLRETLRAAEGVAASAEDARADAEDRCRAAAASAEHRAAELEQTRQDLGAALAENAALGDRLAAAEGRVCVFERRSPRHRLGTFAHRYAVIRRLRSGRRRS